MKVYIISYKRAGAVSTAKILPSADIVIRESDYKDYKKHHSSKKLIVIADKEDGSYMRKVNKVLDMTDSKEVVIIDDDLKKLYSPRGGKNISESEYLHWAENAFRLCYDLGCGIWGLHQFAQEWYYSEGAPFSLTKFFAITWGGGIIKSEIRMNEKMPRYPDVDFWLRHLLRDKITLRLNNIGIQMSYDDAKQSGGISYGDAKKENEIFFKVWGNQIVRIDNGIGRGAKQIYKGV